MRTKVRARALLGALLLLGSAACLEEVTEVRPLSIELTVSDSVVATGETVMLTWRVEGTGLSRAVVEWGDGAADSANYSGPVTAEGEREHVYATAGSYVVVGTATDIEGSTSDSLTITVN
jgi:hypothetical protein